MKTFINIYGWYGVVAIVLAYFLLSFSIIDSTNIWYQVLNATGAFGVLIESLYKKDYQSMTLNIVWTLIATVAIIKLFV
jgi:hypothetical protein